MFGFQKYGHDNVTDFGEVWELGVDIVVTD